LDGPVIEAGVSKSRVAKKIEDSAALQIGRTIVKGLLKRRLPVLVLAGALIVAAANCGIISHPDRKGLEYGSAFAIEGPHAYRVFLLERKVAKDEEVGQLGLVIPAELTPGKYSLSLIVNDTVKAEWDLHATSALKKLESPYADNRKNLQIE